MWNFSGRDPSQFFDCLSTAPVDRYFENVTYWGLVLKGIVPFVLWGAGTAIGTYSRIGLLRSYGNLQSYWTTAKLGKLTVVLDYCR